MAASKTTKPRKRWRPPPRPKAVVVHFTDDEYETLKRIAAQDGVRPDTKLRHLVEHIAFARSQPKWFETVTPQPPGTRSPIERMIDEACGVPEKRR